MKLLNWLSGQRVHLSSSQRQRLASLPPSVAGNDLPLLQGRLLVLDLETSGLNIYRDQVLSIGAVAIERGGIAMGEQFEATLRRPGHKVTEAVLLHGIAPSALARGCAAADALLDFLQFAAGAPLFAFHAPFDQRMLGRSLKQDLGYRWHQRMLDVAEIAPMLCPEARVGRGGLDDWLQYFGLNNSARHHAAADAQATAELLLILLSKARQQGIVQLGELTARLGHWRRLQQSRAV